MAHGPFRGRATFVCFLLLIWAGVATFTARATSETTPAAPDWVFECAACPHNFYDLGPRSAQIDAAGIAHVVYGGEALYHAWQTVDGWQVEIVEDGPGVGSQAALVIAGDGTLHIFYLDEQAQALHYAHGTTGAWTLETVATGIGDEPWPSPAVMPARELRLAFHDGAKNELVYAWQDAGDWQFSTVDAGVGHHPSLALDSDGRPHVGYTVVIPGERYYELRYAQQNGGWQVETVYTDTRSLESALALDSAGQPRLVYAGSDALAYRGPLLMYAYLQAGSWQHEVADDAEGCDDYALAVGYDISLALDGDGRPHVSYTSLHNSTTPYPSYFYTAPRYATRNQDGWSVTFLGCYGDTEKTAIVLDDARQPQVFYRQVGDLVHSFHAGDWQHEVVDAGGIAGIGASMALDAGGMAHISSIGNPTDSYFRQLLYTQCASSGWESELIGSSSQASTSLAVTPDGYPYVLYNTYTRFFGDLVYRYRDTSGWNFEYVGSDGAFYDIAISRDSRVHAVWILPPWLGVVTGPLYYSPLAGTEPVTPELISGATVRMVSLATDAAGRPHVAYSAGGALLYAYRDDTGWHEEAPTSSGFGVDYVALALDGRGRPHVAFYAAYSRDLYYARRDDAGWHVQPIDTAGDAGQFPAIAVSYDGYAHISYYDATNQDLKYAHGDKTGWFWTTETVASEGDVGMYTSIALHGYPHISYYDATRADLMYVYKPFIPVAFSHLPLVVR